MPVFVALVLSFVPLVVVLPLIPLRPVMLVGGLVRRFGVDLAFFAVADAGVGVLGVGVGLPCDEGWRAPRGGLEGVKPCVEGRVAKVCMEPALVGMVEEVVVEMEEPLDVGRGAGAAPQEACC